MKQDHSDIHIWEAFEAGGTECPVCSVENRTKARLVESIFGETVMDYDFQRSLGPKNSFCKEHFEELYKYNDKLGLAIIVDRIMEYEQKVIREAEKSETRSALQKKLAKLVVKPKPELKKDRHREKCVLCRRIEASTHNSMKILLDIWKKDEAFRSLYQNSNGFCLQHFEGIMEVAADSSKDSKLVEEFIQITLALQLDNTAKLHKELKWFIDKFDYRNTEEPWGNSRDSLYRSLVKLAGYFDKPEE